MPKTAKSPADYILPLYINGLSGRMIKMPPPKGKDREILFIYGHHSSLERWFGVAEYLNKYCGVTVPDLPGFGGMDPFYCIGEKPSLDNFADYLATFIKLRYKNRRFSLGGLSLGFMIITRMLQKYPEIADKVDQLYSFAGLTHKNDFKFSKTRYWIYRIGTRVISYKLPSLFFRYVILQPIFIRGVYKFTYNAKEKFAGLNDETFRRFMDVEVNLWHSNDVRTWAQIANTMFKLDLTRRPVNLPVHHVEVESDRYFDPVVVEQNMRTIYEDFHAIRNKHSHHSPSIIATAREAKDFFPSEVSRLLKMKL